MVWGTLFLLAVCVLRVWLADYERELGLLRSVKGCVAECKMWRFVVKNRRFVEFFEKVAV